MENNELKLVSGKMYLLYNFYDASFETVPQRRGKGIPRVMITERTAPEFNLKYLCGYS